MTTDTVNNNIYEAVQYLIKTAGTLIKKKGFSIKLLIMIERYKNENRPSYRNYYCFTAEKESYGPVSCQKI